jgi:hypothetical protein
MKQCKRIDILIPLLGVVGSIDVDDGEVACAAAIGMGLQLLPVTRFSLWGALLDAQGAFVADPFPLWAGLMDTMEVTDGAEPSVALRASRHAPLRFGASAL